MYYSDETSSRDYIPVKISGVNEMETTDSPYVEGGYVDLDAKGTGKPIIIRPTQQDTHQTEAEEESPSVSGLQSSETVTEDHGLQHLKLANNITATPLPLEHVLLRDVPSDVGYPSSPYCSTDDGNCEYLLKQSKETYKLSKSPGKKKLGSKQRRASGLNLIPDPSPYGAVRRFNNFNEVLGHVPEYVNVSGQTYRVHFVPQDPDLCTTSGANTPSKEMNLLEAGSIDRPPERTDTPDAFCPEKMADELISYNEPATYNEPLNLTFSCQPLDLSASHPLNLSINHQDESQVNTSHIPTFANGSQVPTIYSHPLNLSINSQNQSQVNISQVSTFADGSQANTLHVPSFADGSQANTLHVPSFADGSQANTLHVPSFADGSQVNPSHIFTLADDLTNREPAMPGIDEPVMSGVSVGSPRCTITSRNQSLLVTPNQIPINLEVEGNIPNIDSLNLGNNQPTPSKQSSGQKSLQEMLNAGVITKEQLLVLYVTYLAKKASPCHVQNVPQLCLPSLPSTSNVTPVVQRPVELDMPSTYNVTPIVQRPVELDMPGTSNFTPIVQRPVELDMPSTSNAVGADPSAIELDANNSLPNPLPNLSSLQLADDRGEIFITDHEKTMSGLKDKLLNR